MTEETRDPVTALEEDALRMASQLLSAPPDQTALQHLARELVLRAFMESMARAARASSTDTVQIEPVVTQLPCLPERDAPLSPADHGMIAGVPASGVKRLTGLQLHMSAHEQFDLFTDASPLRGLAVLISRLQAGTLPGVRGATVALTSPHGAVPDGKSAYALAIVYAPGLLDGRPHERAHFGIRVWHRDAPPNAKLKGFGSRTLTLGRGLTFYPFEEPLTLYPWSEVGPGADKSRLGASLPAPRRAVADENAVSPVGNSDPTVYPDLQPGAVTVIPPTVPAFATVPGFHEAVTEGNPVTQTAGSPPLAPVVPPGTPQQRRFRAPNPNGNGTPAGPHRPGTPPSEARSAR